MNDSEPLDESRKLKRKRLGSLAQSARGKELNSARNTMIVIGILTILVNIGLLFLAESEVDRELSKLKAQAGPGAFIKPDARDKILTFVRVVYGATAFLGVVFIGLGLAVYRAPVVCTVTALVIYIAAIVIYGVLEPTTLAAGFIIKIIIIVGLAKAIQAAVAYQRKSNETQTEVDE